MQGDVIDVRADGEARARREYSEGFKRKLVALTQAAGASVSRIAQQHKVNANLLFAWRRQFGAPAKLRARRAAAAPTPPLLPVTIEPHGVEQTQQPQRDGGHLEVEIAGACVRIHGTVDVRMLEAVLRMLERAR